MSGLASFVLCVIARPTVFASTPVVGCLTCVSQALETYAPRDDATQDEAVADALSRVTGGLVESICGYVRSAPDPEAQPELLTSYWEMCHRCLVFVPGLLLALPCAPELFESAIACVRHQEFQHTRAVLTFLCLFMSGTESAGPFRETVLMAMQEGLHSKCGKVLMATQEGKHSKCRRILFVELAAF